VITPWYVDPTDASNQIQCIAVAHTVPMGYNTNVYIVEVTTSLKKVKELRYKGKYQVFTLHKDDAVLY